MPRRLATFPLGCGVLKVRRSFENGTALKMFSFYECSVSDIVQIKIGEIGSRSF